MHASPSLSPTHTGRARFRWASVRVAVAALMVLVAVAAPAAAQDRGEPAPVDGGADSGGSDASGDTGNADPGDAGESADTNEPADISASGDDEIQIVEVNSDALPRVDVVLAVPPDFAGQLPADAFGLTEAGQVRSVEVAKLEEIIEVVIIIDTSGSMRGAPIAAAKQAAQDFINALDDQTRIAVVGFGATAQTVADFDDDRATALDAIAALEANGETALYDALALGTSEFGNSNARRFAVVLSDGNDTVSSLTQANASTALGASDSTFYAITLVSDDADFTALEAITADVEGQLIAATDDSLGDVYDNVASRISNLYRLSYDSQVDGAHRVVISLQLNNKLAFASDDMIFTAAPVADASGPSTPIDTGEVTVETRTTPEGILQSETALYIGAGTIFVLIAGLLFFAMSRQPQGAIGVRSFEPAVLGWQQALRQLRRSDRPSDRRC